MAIMYIRDAEGNFAPVPSVSGKDGVSVTHSWDGTTLTVTSASGTSSADLKGEKGDPGAQGPSGPAGSFDMANPETTGVFYHKGNGTGNTGNVLKIQSNNGVLTGYGDVSSAFHLGGVPVYFDTLVFFGNGFSFPTPGGTLTGNFTQLKGFSHAEFRTGTTNHVETGCNFDGYPTVEQQGFIVKNIAPAGGHGDNWSYQAFNQKADGTWERVFGVKADGTVISKDVAVRPDFIVNITTSDNVTYTADKTHAEILAAYNAGCNCAAYNGKFFLPLIVVNANLARFSVLNGMNVITFVVGAAGVTQYVTDQVITSTYGGTLLSGATLTLSQDPTTPMMAATKQYVDSVASGGGGGDFLPLAGGTLTGHLLPSGAVNLGDDANRWENIFGKIYYFSDAANASAFKFGMYQWGDNFTFVVRNSANSWIRDAWQINANTGATNFSARPTFNGEELALKSEAGGGEAMTVAQIRAICT